MWDHPRLSVERLGPLAVAELQRLAAEAGGGYQVLELLDHIGWSVAIVSALGGGVLVLAQQRAYPHVEISAQGATVADVAGDLFKEALTYGAPSREH